MEAGEPQPPQPPQQYEGKGQDGPSSGAGASGGGGGGENPMIAQLMQFGFTHDQVRTLYGSYGSCSGRR